MAARELVEKRCAHVASHCAGNGLRRASRAITQLYAKILAPSGLQPTQFSLLVACAVTGETPMTALADALPLWEKAQERVAEAFGRQRLSRILQEVAALESLVRKG